MSAGDSSNILNRLELSHNLRGSLQHAAGYAYQQSHREVTLEHLLLALTEDRDAAVILEASNVDLSGLVTEVSDYLGRLEDRVAGDDARQPTLGRDLIHICQSAAAAAQKSQRRAIGSALVLAAIVGEGRSPSAQMLRNHGLTFEQAIEALRQSNAAQAARPVASAEPQPPQATVAQEAPATSAPPATDQSPQPEASSAQGEQPREAAPEAAPVDPRIRGPIRKVQAARDILAGARERVAAVGGGPVSSPQSEMQPSPPAAAPATAPPEADTATQELSTRPDAAARVGEQASQTARQAQDPVEVNAVAGFESVETARPAVDEEPPRKARHDREAPAEAATPEQSDHPPPPAQTPEGKAETQSAPHRAPQAPEPPASRTPPLPASPPPEGDMPPPGPPPARAEPIRPPGPPPNAPPPPSRTAPAAKAAEQKRPSQPPMPERDGWPAPHLPPASPPGPDSSVAHAEGGAALQRHPSVANQPPVRRAPPPQLAGGAALPSHPDDLRALQRPPVPARPPHPDWTSRERPMTEGDLGPRHPGKRPRAPRPVPPPTGEPVPGAASARTPKPGDVANFDPKVLVSDFPKRMRVGKPVTIAVRVPRHQLEAWSGGGSDPATMSRQVITKAMMMRLKAAGSGFAVENASPETQWSEGYDGPLSDDIVSWRWVVTPRRIGRQALQLSGATRVVGRDGLAAERPLPPQRATIRVSPNYLGMARRLAIWLAIAGTAGALGYFADGLFDMGRSVLAQLVG